MNSRQSLHAVGSGDVDLELEYAGFWVRVGATLIDTALLAIVTLPILVPVYGWGYFAPRSTVIAGPVDFMLTWVAPAFAVVLFWVYREATPGKMALTLSVIDARTGRSLGVGQAIGRYLAYFISALPLCLGYIWVGFDSRKQAWHDKLAGTVVVRPVQKALHPVFPSRTASSMAPRIEPVAQSHGAAADSKRSPVEARRE